MKEVIIDGEEIAIFSDIHWGKSRDAEVKIATNIQFMEKFTDFVAERNIKHVIFGGDWFDNRNYISVKTQNRAYDCLKKLADIAKVYMIIGNHDAYFKESIDVNSIRTYADMKNIIPIEELTEIQFLPSEKTGLMCPWSAFNLDEVTKKYDTMFGHFEFNGAILRGAVHHGGVSMQTLTETAPLVFSGHFHIRKEYPQRSGKLLTIGSPCELDWGDADNVKGFYTLNTKTLEYTFHENDFSPRHIKIYWSKLKKKQESLKNIKGNYIKLVIDEEYKFDKIMKVLNLINLKRPIKPGQTDFIYNNNFSNILDQFDTDTDEKITTLSKLDYIKKFIDHADDSLEDLDKGVLLGMVNEYYNLTE